MNIPNILTLFRIAASFVFLFYSFRGEWSIAFWIFCVAAFTDMVDGSIARLLRQRTRLGAVLDPMADKLLMFFGFVTLTKGHFIAWWLTTLVIMRDLLIVGGVFYLRRQKIPIVFRPTYLSKATTFFQIVTLFSALMVTRNQFFLQAYFPIIMAVTAGLTFITGMQYVRIGLRMLKSERAS
ncbi:MAG: CDP-alcohol phosphatidyltransferase family protein, partial [Deltaproteobacteria bacterium]|nr:CDP-alcohol phosphatidyltransferase family protein [Deltaproteobacteria bacterium]